MDGDVDLFDMLLFFVKFGRETTRELVMAHLLKSMYVDIQGV